MRKYIQTFGTWEHDISVYDVDDTLIKSTATINVTDTKKNITTKYSTLDFSNLKRLSHYDINFDGFEDVKHIKNGILIKENVNKLIKDFKNKKALAIVTGRGEKEPVKLLLHIIGVHIPDDMIYTVSAEKNINSQKELADNKAIAFIDLIKKGYKNFIYYDDSLDNLKRVKSLEETFDIKIKTIHT